MVDGNASKMFVKMASVYGGSLATFQKKKKNNNNKNPSL